MESIEKLCRYAQAFLAAGNEEDLLGIADEIEREIAEHYLLLPVDSEGVPIHVGDLIEFGSKGERLEVTHIGWTRHGDPAIAYRRPNGTLDCSCIGSECRHIKPRTVEDVLREAVLAIVDVSYQNVPGIGNVPKLCVDEGKLRDWLEEHDELRMRDAE